MSADSCPAIVRSRMLTTDIQILHSAQAIMFEKLRTSLHMSLVTRKPVFGVCDKLRQTGLLS